MRKRRVCAGLVAAGLLALAGCGGGAAKPTGPIKVGFILPLTGVFAANAQDERDGWNLALKDAGGSVAGRKIQTIFVDDASDPNQGLTDARQLVQTQKVDVLIGPIAANVGLAIRGFVASSGIPTLYPSACSVELATTEKTPNLILTGWTCDQPTLNFGKYVCDTLGYKHLTTVAMDYAFGWQVTGGFVSSYTGAGCRIDKQIWAPFNATDYSPYVSQIPQDTQAVFDLAAGSAAVRFTQAYQAFGLKGKIPLVGGGTLTDYSAMRSESPESVLGAVTVLQYADGLDTPANKAFVQEYHGATGKYPSYYAESAYATAKLLIAALKKLNGDTSDRKALVNAFKTTPFDAPRGPVKIDPATNSPIQNIYIRRVEMVNGVLRNVVVDTIKQSPPWGPLPRSRWEVQAAHYGRTG
ncbi:MAG TPA: ABC transporter substrate-binding protein [Candidatus Dormibacteraeota bacterium]|nr:ABC transporter substrate-binding protein [Candidatus Dormibacteraeota bacterium]